MMTRCFVPDALVFHPWRRRKGFAFVKAHARSVATFVGLHPERAYYFSFTSQFVKSIRSIWFASRDLCSFFLIRGFMRRIMLDLTGHYLAWLYVRRLDLPPTSYPLPTK
jgi:hypothetical protein